MKLQSNDAQRYQVLALPTKQPLRARMLHMGLIRGAFLTLNRRLPAWGLVELDVRGTRLLLRDEEWTELTVIPA